MKRDALLTVPNTISLSRVLLAVAFVLARGPWERVALIAAAGLTDFLDGWLARRQKIETRAGALLDPVADRAFVITALAVYLYESLITPIEFFVVIARDLATAFGFLLAQLVPSFRSAVFEARVLGKSVTVLQLVFLIVILVAPRFGDMLVLALGVVSAASIVDYATSLWRSRTR